VLLSTVPALVFEHGPPRRPLHKQHHEQLLLYESRLYEELHQEAVQQLLSSSMQLRGPQLSWVLLPFAQGLPLLWLGYVLRRSTTVHELVAALQLELRLLSLAETRPVSTALWAEQSVHSRSSPKDAGHILQNGSVSFETDHRGVRQRLLLASRRCCLLCHDSA